MNCLSPQKCAATLPEPLLGISTLVRLVYDQGDITPVWDGLMARLGANPGDTSALMDVSVLLQTTGQREKGLELQSAAIATQPVYRRVHGNGRGLRIIAFVTAGDMMANTPIDFLLEGSDVTLYFVYVDAKTRRLPELPDADVAFMAIGESAGNRAVLENIGWLLLDWQGPPILNGAPEHISMMTRDGVHSLLAEEPSIVSPPNVPASRTDLADICQNPACLESLLPGADFPLIIRPIGTHAGHGMEKLDDLAALGAYLARHADAQFYLAPFIDYSGPDGLFRKQRVVFINGRAFASHYAVSEHWMVHYLSASMVENAERRNEEAEWMRTFDEDFARRHATSIDALCRCFGLDYFGVDCAEMPDGRLLVFEADVAMIVHDMDSELVFPYKKPAMRKLFRAFHAALAEAGGHTA
ncbi:MAG: tetratricopeptide repeat-containing protein [Hyphomicrobiales bacterium]|nr:tetratricopeptide repeat-containing protein [Hyphomicrobiales bacterium]